MKYLQIFSFLIKVSDVFFSLDISIMQIMIGVHGWPGPSMIKNNFGFLFRMHLVFLLFLIPSNFWMCDECIQFQSFPAEEWTPSNSKVNILSKTFHSKKKIVEKCQKKTLWLPPNWRRNDDFSSCVGLWLKFGQWCLTLVDLVVD